MQKSMCRLIKLNGSHASTETEALFDLNVRQTYVRREIAEKLGVPTRSSRPVAVSFSNAKTVLPATHFIALEFELDGKLVDWSCKVADDLPFPVVVGSVMMSSSRIVLDLINEVLIVEKNDPVEVIACW